MTRTEVSTSPVTHYRSFKETMIIFNPISIVLPVFNQQDLIPSVLQSLCKFSSRHVRELIIIIDGCTDKTEERIYETLKDPAFRKFTTVIIPNDPPGKFEVLACNQGFRSSNYDYSLNIQDDMVMTTQDFDQILMKPFKETSVISGKYVFAVTARDAVNVYFNEKQDWIVFGDHRGTREPGIFSIRDIINRGPVLFDNEKLKELNYLDEAFAPLAQDDTDICLRAWRKGWMVGSYCFPYESKLEWGTTRKNSESRSIQSLSEQKNIRLIMERHSDLLRNQKHSVDLKL